MRSTMLAGALVALLPSAGQAQTMTCADYLKADKRMQAQMAGVSMSTGDAKMDATAAAMDKKLRDYCAKNPTLGVDKAMEEAMK